MFHVKDLPFSNCTKEKKNQHTHTSISRDIVDVIILCRHHQCDTERFLKSLVHQFNFVFFFFIQFIRQIEWHRIASYQILNSGRFNYTTTTTTKNRWYRNWHINSRCECFRMTSDSPTQLHNHTLGDTFFFPVASRLLRQWCVLEWGRKWAICMWIDECKCEWQLNQLRECVCEL